MMNDDECYIGYNSNFAKEPAGYNHSYRPHVANDGEPGKCLSSVSSYLVKIYAFKYLYNQIRVLSISFNLADDD